ncbi:Uncharacterised protein [Klebsiella pneumoniae]|nr:Uncharacterised protein [Klebsiella pneumoniae]
MVTFCALPSLFRVAGTGMWKEALAAPLLTSAVASRASASFGAGAGMAIFAEVLAMGAACGMGAGTSCMAISAP